jgi:MFS transporter, MHS family, alpha-ketoglutarate permease
MSTQSRSSSAVAAQVPTRTRVETFKIIVGTGAGNALEWFDWTIYAIFAPFFAKQFFNPNDQAAALLGTLAVFAVGFLMRPLGGLFFGWLADRRGRRTAMVVAMIVTAASSLVIGLAPGFDVVGILAPILLVSARLAQGFGLGGEIGGSHVYLAEMAPPKHRGFWSSSMYIAVTVGTLSATLLAAGLTSWLGATALSAWGWRIPFIIGGVLGIYALYLRRNLPETEKFQGEQEKVSHQGAQRESLWRGIWENRVSALKVMGLSVGATIVFYTWAVSAPTYAITVKGIDPQQAMWAGVLGNVVFMIALPLWGKASDKWGRKPNLIFFAVSLGLLTYPLTMLIQDSAWQLCLAICIALTGDAALAAIWPATMAELFPTKVRATGFAFPNSIAVALAGGTAPLLQTWLGSIGLSWMFVVYTIFLLAITLVTALSLKETKGKPLD